MNLLQKKKKKYSPMMDFKVHCRHAPQEGDSAEPQISSSSVLCDDLELKTER